MPEEFECEECGKTFDTERGLHVHESQVHKDKDKTKKKTKETEKKSAGKSEERPGPKDIEFEVGPWKLVSGILAILLVVALAFLVQGVPMDSDVETDMETISKEEAGDIVMDFVNEYMIEGEMEDLEAEEVNERYGLYEVVVVVEGMMGPQEQQLYITQDGEVFFPEAVDIGEFKEMMEEQEQMMEEMEDEDEGEIVIDPEEEPEDGEEEIVIEPEE